MFGNRTKLLREHTAKFNEMAVKAEVLWGKSASAESDALRKAIQKWYAAADTFVYNESQQGEVFDQDREFGREIRSTLFCSRQEWLEQPESNEFSSEFMAVIAKIEKLCKEKIRL